jgi:hypothetical protein
MKNRTKFALLLVAISLALVLAPLGLCCTILFCVFRLSWHRAITYLANLALSSALSIDLMGNVVCADLFNTYLIRAGAVHRFGRHDQTISAVLGWNRQLNTLTDLGRATANLLNWIDPNHVENAVAADCAR